MNRADRRSAIEVLGIFARLGFTCFGGPIAHLAYFRTEFVERRRWLSERAYADLVGLCQFLPGPASSKLGFSLGLMRAGYAGGLAAWVGFTLPSAILLVLFAYGASTFSDTALQDQSVAVASWSGSLVDGRDLCRTHARVKRCGGVLVLRCQWSIVKSPRRIRRAAGLILPASREWCRSAFSPSARGLKARAIRLLLALSFSHMAIRWSSCSVFYRSGALVAWAVTSCCLCSARRWSNRAGSARKPSSRATVRRKPCPVPCSAWRHILEPWQSRQAGSAAP